MVDGIGLPCGTTVVAILGRGVLRLAASAASAASAVVILCHDGRNSKIEIRNTPVPYFALLFPSRVSSSFLLEAGGRRAGGTAACKTNEIDLID